VRLYFLLIFYNIFQYNFRVI